MGSSDEEYCSDIERAAQEAISAIIPEKSKALYETAYKKFCDWLQCKNAESICETVMLAFFQEKSLQQKSSSLWCLYSKLRCMIYVRRNQDISKYTSLFAFLKRKNVGHVPKKSPVLSKDNFMRFLTEANDSQYLLVKVYLVSFSTEPVLIYFFH